MEFRQRTWNICLTKGAISFETGHITIDMHTHDAYNESKERVQLGYFTLREDGTIFYVDHMDTPLGLFDYIHNVLDDKNILKVEDVKKIYEEAITELTNYRIKNNLGGD